MSHPPQFELSVNVFFLSPEQQSSLNAALLPHEPQFAKSVSVFATFPEQHNSYGPV